VHEYMYDEMWRRREGTLVGPTARDPVFAGEFSRAMSAVGGEALKSDCSGIRRL